ncbi:dihydroorotate dehydrogenase-like protein [Candidatus Fermentibacteria bacterium]|nr:dihydroorotate dehydrogenase-like protein [Candidatus Fermentibacteria bacterium]
MTLTTSFMGLTLKNPVIVASSGLVRSVEGVVRCAEAGAGAVVLKSLFEEQFEAEARAITDELRESWHAEAHDYVNRMSVALGPEAYLGFVRDAKGAVDIPLIASLNCTSHRGWPEFAKRLVDAGADAVELNLALFLSSSKEDSRAVEDRYLRIVESVRSSVDVPLAVKVGPYFTSMAHMAARFAEGGVSALVLFNRFHQLDIDVAKLGVISGSRFSTPQEMSTSLRWVSLLYGRVDCNLVGATGAHDGTGIVKFILAGATAVQVASAIYLHGMSRVGEMIATIERWMESKGFSSLDEVRGRLSQSVSGDPGAYERFQYIKAIAGIE